MRIGNILNSMTIWLKKRNISLEYMYGAYIYYFLLTKMLKNYSSVSDTLFFITIK